MFVGDAAGSDPCAAVVVQQHEHAVAGSMRRRATGHRRHHDVRQRTPQHLRHGHADLVRLQHDARERRRFAIDDRPFERRMRGSGDDADADRATSGMPASVTNGTGRHAWAFAAIDRHRSATALRQRVTMLFALPCSGFMFDEDIRLKFGAEARKQSHLLRHGSRQVFRRAPASGCVDGTDPATGHGRTVRQLPMPAAYSANDRKNSDHPRNFPICAIRRYPASLFRVSQ